MRLDLTLASSVISFTTTNGTGPDPHLTYVGDLRMAARGLRQSGGAESSNLGVTLQNDDKRAATIIGDPMRVRADIYDDAGVLFFSGLVANVQYGRLIELSIES